MKRLLALEGYKLLSEMGVKCSLLTGQQRITIEGASHTSCTVEMLDSLRGSNDMLVLDEVQLIGDQSRGWAWTKQIISSNQKRVIMCGQPNAG